MAAIMLTVTMVVLFVAFLLGGIFFVWKIYQKRADIWLPAYLRSCLFPARNSRNKVKSKLTHVFFLFVDHFEPGNGGADAKEMQRRCDAWMLGYPKMAQKFTDADGKHPQHTWFYPPHYDVNYLQQISGLCYDGFGEIEMHLHHENDTSESLRVKLEDCKRLYRQFGALITAEKNPRQVYGFIHGMWALDNSADGKHCGVNNELQVLNATGCYADFTLPSGYKTQTRKINSIYYAIDDHDRPKSHDTGIDLEAGKFTEGDLLIVQGPLGINWKSRPFPKIENASITRRNSPTPDRIDYWVKCGIGVKGRPNWIFIKVHTHGAVPRDWDSIFGDAAEKMHAYLGRKYNDGSQYKLHYVTAREAYNIIKAVEAGEQGEDPNQYRDYLIPPYANTRIQISHPYKLLSYTPDGIVVQINHDGINRIKMHGFLLKSCEGNVQYFSYREEPKSGNIVIIVEGDGKTIWTLGRDVKLIEGQNADLISKYQYNGDTLISRVINRGVNFRIELSVQP